MLEEMPEEDSARLIASLALDRSADVVQEMQPDDAADLLAELPAEYRERLLKAMPGVQADEVRRLLVYDAATAGGLIDVAAADLRAAGPGSRGARQDPERAGGRDRGGAGLRVRAAAGDADGHLPG